MDIMPQNKEHELLLRVFKLIEQSHFHDHKCVKTYIAPVEFPRGLGTEVGNWVQSHYGKFYNHRRDRGLEAP